jgi:hypothetical protein
LINEGIETLTSLANQIDTARMKSPAFKMILKQQANMPIVALKMEFTLYQQGV